MDRLPFNTIGSECRCSQAQFINLLSADDEPVTSFARARASSTESGTVDPPSRLVGGDDPDAGV